MSFNRRERREHPAAPLRRTSTASTWRSYGDGARAREPLVAYRDSVSRSETRRGAGGRRAAVRRARPPVDLRGDDMIRPAELIQRKRDGEELARRRARRAGPRLRARRGARLPDGRVLHGRLLPRALRARDVRAHRRDDPQRRDARPRRAARPQGRRQALDRRRRRQDVACRRADRRGLRRPVREDERPRASGTRAARSTSSSRSRATAPS